MSAPTRSRDLSVPVAGVPSAPAMPEDVQALLHRLRLPHIRRHAPDVIATAKAQRWEPVEVLRALLTEEAAGRERSALATRRAGAGFPTGKTFDAWKPSASSIPAPTPTQQALRTLEWVHRRENLVVCGPSGTGKTFLLEALAGLPQFVGRFEGCRERLSCSGPCVLVKRAETCRHTTLGVSLDTTSGSVVVCEHVPAGDEADEPRRLGGGLPAAGAQRAAPGNR